MPCSLSVVVRCILSDFVRLFLYSVDEGFPGCRSVDCIHCESSSQALGASVSLSLVMPKDTGGMNRASDLGVRDLITIAPAWCLRQHQCSAAGCCEMGASSHRSSPLIRQLPGRSKLPHLHLHLERNYHNQEAPNYLSRAWTLKYTRGDLEGADTIVALAERCSRNPRSVQHSNYRTIHTQSSPCDNPPLSLSASGHMHHCTSTEALSAIPKRGHRHPCTVNLG